ncbi:hypothetical protein ACP26L_35900 (plasmid) [Paenibacillus sp. S-38]
MDKKKCKATIIPTPRERKMSTEEAMALSIQRYGKMYERLAKK